MDARNVNGRISNVKRTFACGLALVMLLLSLPAWAEPVPSRAAITIDGIRTAFFDREGAYLEPLEQDGVLYVPVLPLAESLQLEVTADADTLAVSLRGVRMAFFDAKGAYLPPISVGGQVYVPLAAFAESAGIPLDRTDGGYALTRAAQSAALTAEPRRTPEPTPIELYGYVPLGMDNYARYFETAQTYYAPDGLPSSFTIRYTATVTATTGYSPTNVRITLRNYGTVSVPPSGRATITYNSETIRGSSRDEQYIWDVASMKTRAILNTTFAPDVTAVSGSLRMSKAEADRINEEDYSRALRVIQSDKSSSSALRNAQSIMQRLATVDHKDSAQQARQAQSKIAAAVKREQEEKAAAEERKKEARYEEALKAREAGEYDKAIDEFSALGKEGYKDSQAQVGVTQDAKKADGYSAALRALEDGDFAAAISGFKALGAYQDSADRLRQAEQGLEQKRFDLYENDYLAAVKLQEANDFAAAVSAFEPLAAVTYRDSAQRLKKVVKAQETLTRWEEAYQRGVTAEKALKWDEALKAFLECLSFRNAQAHAAACVINLDGIYITPPRDQGAYFIYEKQSGYANTRTGEFRLFDSDTQLVTTWMPELWPRGLAAFKSANRFGLMDAAGKVLLDAEYDAFVDAGPYIAAFKRNDGYVLMDAKGVTLKNSRGQAYKLHNVTAVKSACGSVYTLSSGEPLLISPDGAVTALKRGHYPLASNDGGIYTVYTLRGQQVLTSPDGKTLLTAEGIACARTLNSKDERFQIYDGVVSFSKNGKWGLYDTVRGRELLKPAYDAVESFTAGGAARVVKNKKHGVISAKGKVLTKPEHAFMEPFSGGMARVGKNVSKSLDGKKSTVRVYGFINE